MNGIFLNISCRIFMQIKIRFFNMPEIVSNFNLKMKKEITNLYIPAQRED